MRKLGVTALGVAALLTLAGCSANDAPATTEAATIRVWLVGPDTPQEARDYLKTTFEAENPGSTLVIEEQAWGGLIDKLTTSLSGSDSPDVVEVGNTQAPAFTSAGAFVDLTDKYEELGGADLLPGFVEAGSYDGKFYAAPYYAGARIVFFRKDLYAAAGLSIPKTLDEYISNGKALAAANPGVSGIYFPGQDWYNTLPYLWENGGDIATVDDSGKWTAELSSAGSIAGLKQVQDVMLNASVAPKDGNEAEAQVPYCAGVIGQISAPPWFQGSVLAATDADAPGCPDQESNLGVFALPGLDGGAAQIFAGGSNIAVSAKSQNPELATKALAIMLSDTYQSSLGKMGLVPAKVSLSDTLGTTELAQVIAASTENVKLTPASPRWADVDAAGIMPDLFVKVAQGRDVSELAAEADAKINALLNG